MMEMANPALTLAQRERRAKKARDLYALPMGLSYIADLEGDQLSSLKDYSVSGYGDLNEPLREGIPLHTADFRASDIVKMHQHLTEAAMPLTDPLTVWRGTIFWEKHKDVYRHDLWRDPAWVSTSLDRKIAEGHSDIFHTRRRPNEPAYLIKMNLAAGIKVVPMGTILHLDGVRNGHQGYFVREKEITLEPNLNYRVTRREIMFDEIYDPYTILEVAVTK